MTREKGHVPSPDDDRADVEVGDVEILYRGFMSVERHRFRVRRFDGSTMTVERELLERGKSVCVLPYDPKSDRVLLIRHFLIGSLASGGPPMPLQVVAGMVDEGETEEESVRREALEEANCEIGRLIEAQAFLPSPGGSSERVVAFCGEADLETAGGVYGAPNEGEDIRVEVVDADVAVALLDEGRIESGPAVVILSWFARHRERVRQAWLCR